MSSELNNLLNEMAGDEFSSGDVLRAFRKRIGLSQEELAELTGIERPNISALENDRTEMTQHYAELCAAALKLHPSELLYPNNHYEMNDRAREIAKRTIAFLEKKQSRETKNRPVSRKKVAK